MSAYRLPTLLLAIAVAAPQPVAGQTFKRGGVEFNALREVAVPAGKTYTVLVTEFFTHGELRPDGRNLIVATRGQQIAPFRVLQVGPGDFCRVAILLVAGQREYDILYGGEPLPEGAVPAWTNRDGLLMETRQYKKCDASRLESVQAAFTAAKPIGADYVEALFHSHNPFTLVSGPFLTHYVGHMNVASTGKYGFFTGAVDCGYLLIDDKLVTSRRGMLRQARPETRSVVQLTAGRHQVDYYHVAAGSQAMISAAWEVEPQGEKPAPTAIPADVWRTPFIARALASPVVGRVVRMPPDFLARIEGSAPLPDNDVPLVRVFFKNTTPRGLLSKARVRWEFGDGQTSEETDAAHVFLRPGMVSVKLTVSHPQRTVETVNRLYVDRPFESRFTKVHTLDDYLPQIVGYNPRTLDASSLRQLALALEAKAAATAAPQEALAWIGKAVERGKAAFLDAPTAGSDADLVKLARLVGVMARDRLGQSQLAFDIWRGASRRIRSPEFKAECAAQAADAALCDLLKPDLAKPLLNEAVKYYDGGKTGVTAGSVRRIAGDLAAAGGDGKSARKAYFEAEKIRNSHRNRIEQTAWRGAYNRSVEDYLKTRQFDRAIAEIRVWQQDYPTDKIDGQLTMMYAHYWAGLARYDQAIALCEQLLTVNPDSPYADSMLQLAASCASQGGQSAKAIALLHSLVKDYPGSPLAPAAKETIAKMESGVAQGEGQSDKGTKGQRNKP